MLLFIKMYFNYKNNYNLLWIDKFTGGKFILITFSVVGYEKCPPKCMSHKYYRSADDPALFFML